MPDAELSRFGERTSLEWVTRALTESRRISSVGVLWPSEEREAIAPFLPDDRRFSFLESELSDQLLNFSPKSGDGAPFEAQIELVLEKLGVLITEPTLLLSAETVLLRGSTLDELVSHCVANSLDSGLVWCPRGRAEKVLPPRAPDAPDAASFLLREKVNWAPVALFGPDFLRGARAQWKIFGPSLASLGGEKAPSFGRLLPLGFRAAKMLGWMFVFRALKRQLTIKALEKTVGRVFDCRFDLIETWAPEILLRASEPTHRKFIESRLPVP